jgi:hypothetical protein
MSVTVKYKVSFDGASKPVTTPLARRLALAHAIDRLVEQGVLRSYAEAARVMGITRGSVAAVIGLLYLSPALQTAVLDGELEAIKRELRGVLSHVSWERQKGAIPCNYK